MKVYPLLDKLAGEPDSLVRRSVLTAISALAQPGTPAATNVVESLSEKWSERVCHLLMAYKAGIRFEGIHDTYSPCHFHAKQRSRGAAFIQQYGNLGR